MPLLQRPQPYDVGITSDGDKQIQYRTSSPGSMGNEKIYDSDVNDYIKNIENEAANSSQKWDVYIKNHKESNKQKSNE